MLKRTLEPEVMDSLQEARDYDSMDHSAVNRVFVDDFLAAAISVGLFAMPQAADVGAAGATILDLGAGTAQIPIELCRQMGDAPTSVAVRIVAIDLADEMLKLAERNVERAGLRDRIRLERVDCKRLPYAAATFAAVMSNSIVHHIPEPRSVLAEALRVVRAGGLVFVRDLLRPGDAAEVRRLVEVYAVGANEHQRALFEASLGAALNLEEIREIVASFGIRSDSVRQTSDRHWTWSFAC